MTNKPKKYCDGIDCAWCGEKEPCIYKIANELEEQLKRKEQECERLKQGYAELTEIVSPYMDDFTGYNEELGGFDIVLCVKQLLEQLDQLKETNGSLLSIQYELADSNTKLRQTLTKIKNVLEVYFDDDWKATREIEKIIEGKDEDV